MSIPALIHQTIGLVVCLEYKIDTNTDTNKIALSKNIKFHTMEIIWKRDERRRPRQTIQQKTFQQQHVEHSLCITLR